MISRRERRTIRGMKELLCDELWPTIHRLARAAETRRAAVAYVTDDDVLRFGKGDVLVTDASNRAIAAGQTRARVLQRALKDGAELYSLEGLHAKVILLDGMAIFGSANISRSSRKVLIEAAWVTDDLKAAGLAASLIDRLVRKAKRIDPRFIERILAIEVAVPARRSRRRPKIGRIQHRTWIATIREIVEAPEEDREDIEAGVDEVSRSLQRADCEPSWIRFTGDTRFRREARVGDTVIQIFHAAGSKRPRVYPPANIRILKPNRRRTLFFLEEPAGGDISWTAFVRLLHEARFRGRLGANSTRELAAAVADELARPWR